MLSPLTMIVLTLLFLKLAAEISTGTFFKRIETESALKGLVIDSSPVASLVECGLKCSSLQPNCKSFNYVKALRDTTICEINDITKQAAPSNDFVRQTNSEYFEPMATVYNPASCKVNEVAIKNFATDGPWNLIARFSNVDPKHWMKNDGRWWYDTEEAYGSTHNPNENSDMLSEAFWLQKGSEFRITKSDDTAHTALLTTTGNCLGGKTFRSKMASYGVFRGSTAWASSRCLGNCHVIYDGDYTTVEGFGQSECDGNIQTKNFIGFWCHYGGGNGSVLMIGGGGSGCSRAAHGIGITEENGARFKGNEMESDFGNQASKQPTKLYSLNLWVR